MVDVFFLDGPSAQGVMAIEIVAYKDAHMHQDVGCGLTSVAEQNILQSPVDAEPIFTPSGALSADLPPQPR